MKHYETLGAQRGDSAGELKRHYRRAARAAHPDREGGSHERMQAVNAAWETLGDPERRERYDRTGDDRPAADPKARAKQELAKAFAEILLKVPDNVDPVAHLLKELDANKAQADQALRDANRNAARMRSKAQRIKSKGADNLLAGVAESLAMAAETAKQQALEKLGLVRDVRELLGDYSYEMTEEERNARSPVDELAEEMFAQMEKMMKGGGNPFFGSDFGREARRRDPRGEPDRPSADGPGDASPPCEPFAGAPSGRRTGAEKPFYRSKERW